jgi:hypothetical protein
MRTRTLLSLAVLAAAVAVSMLSDAAFITWSNIHAEGPSPITDWTGRPVPGEVTFGTPDFSKGALVQLWKAMHEASPGGIADIDDPNAPGLTASFESTDWKIDDILLDVVHCGYGTFVHPEGTWSQSGSYAASTGNTIYVRAYNLPKPQWDAAAICVRDITIRNQQGNIVSATLTRDDIPPTPMTFYFDNLHLAFPEPAPLLLVLPGLGIWLARRRKTRRGIT